MVLPMLGLSTDICEERAGREERGAENDAAGSCHILKTHMCDTCDTCFFKKCLPLSPQ